MINNTKRRAVITGMGAVTPYGIGADIFFESIKNGKSAISNIERFPLEGHVVTIAGEIKNRDFDKMGYIDFKEMRRTDIYSQFAMVASDGLIENAKIDKEKIDPYRFGVIVGSAGGGFSSFEKQQSIMTQRGVTKCSPFTVPMVIGNLGAGLVSMRHGTKGLNKDIVTACATSTHCIGDAMRSIQYGDADIIIAGGAESIITNLGIGAFSVARTLSRRNDEPTKASRPYDIDRDGFVMSEGSALVIVEELEHAKKRGATIYAEIVGYGQTSDAYDMVAPDPEGKGAIKAMELAVKEAGITPDKVDYINAHGTSTHVGDIAESFAIARVFGDLSTNKNLKVSSTKGAHGHMLGATGAAEIIACIYAINKGIIPPTINLDNQDPEVAKLNYVPNVAIEANVDYALSNSFGFGGTNATLLIKKFEN